MIINKAAKKGAKKAFHWYFKGGEGKEHRRGVGRRHCGAAVNSSLLGFLPREREMVKVVERKKKGKRGQPPLSDLGDPPLEEKQQRKRTCCASVPPPLRRSRRLNPNPDADKICHGKPEKRVTIHPKKEEKQVGSFDFYNDILNLHVMTAEEYFFYNEHILKSDVSKLIRFVYYVFLYIYIPTPFTSSLFVVLGLWYSLHAWRYRLWFNSTMLYQHSGWSPQVHTLFEFGNRWIQHLDPHPQGCSFFSLKKK